VAERDLSLVDRPEPASNSGAGHGALLEESSADVWSTADLFDQHEHSVDVCDTTFLRFGRRRAFSGVCETVLTDDDHQIVLEVLMQPGDGRVLVVDAGGNKRVGVMGDRLARIGTENGWAGVVVNGAIRDSEIIDQFDFGVLAVAVTARRSLEAARGRQGAEIHFGGASFRSGCWVYADANAVLSSKKKLD
jgi:regulator of ribonuclease activity A